MAARPLPTLGERVDQSEASSAWRSKRHISVLAVGAVALPATFLLTGAGTPVADVAKYLAVWVFGMVLPGVILWQFLMGRSRFEIALGGGAVTGIAVFLVSWLVATWLGHGRLAVVAPVVLAGLCLGIQRSRASSSPPDGDRAATPIAWYISMFGVTCLALTRVALEYLLRSPLPPNPGYFSPDTWYYLGIAQQLAHGFPVADPTLAGSTIKYHWFGIAATVAPAQVAGVSAIPAVLHLWTVPFVVVWVWVVAAVTRTVMLTLASKRPAAQHWAWGPLAALLSVVFPLSLVLAPFAVDGLSSGLNYGSASGAFGGLYLLALCFPTAALLINGRHAGAWILLVLLMVASSGTKPTILPLLFCACAVVAAANLRRRSDWIVPALIALASLGAYGLSSLLVIGSSTGVQIQPLGMVAADPGYLALYPKGAAPLPNAGGFLLPALADARPGAVLLVVGYLILFVLGQSLRLFGAVICLLHRDTRSPLVLWISACVFAGFAFALVISHGGLSQQWFAMNVSSLGTVLVVTAVVSLLPSPVTWKHFVRLVGGTAAGTVIGLVTWVVASRQVQDAAPQIGVRLLPYAWSILAGVVVVVAISGVRSSRPQAQGPALPVVLVTLVTMVGACLPWSVLTVTAPITRRVELSHDQQAAALWIAEHAGPHDLVISNVFCRPVPYREVCDHRGVWVSALSGRVLVLDGWAYQPQTVAQYDGTVAVNRLPTVTPDRLRLSLAVIARADPRAVCLAYTQLGVRWIYVDHRATRQASALARYAIERFSSSDASVFELQDLSSRCAAR